MIRWSGGAHRPEVVLCLMVLGAGLVLVLGSPLLRLKAEVYTEPVGFVKASAARDKFTLMSVPLSMQSTLINSGVGAMLAQNLTGGTSALTADQVLKWHSDTQSYETAWLMDNPGHPDDGKWIDAATGSASTMALTPGEGFWVRRRSGGDPSAEVMFLGWVPAAQTTPVVIRPGKNMISHPYPEAVAINDTSLSADGAFGSAGAGTADQVMSFDPTTNAYSTAWLLDLAGHPYDGQWIGAGTLVPSTLTFSPTKGYWYIRRPGTPFTWNAAKPY